MVEASRVCRAGLTSRLLSGLCTCKPAVSYHPRGPAAPKGMDEAAQIRADAVRSCASVLLNKQNIPSFFNFFPTSLGPVLGTFRNCLLFSCGMRQAVGTSQLLLPYLCCPLQSRDEVISIPLFFLPLLHSSC